MTAKKSFTTYFIFSLFLAYLSQPSVVSAWSHPDSAHLIGFDETQKSSISDIGEKQYRKFDLTAPGNVSVVFTHAPTGGLSISHLPAWEIKLQDRALFESDGSYIYKTSERNDNGATCSQWLGQPGTYYLLVKGVDGSILPRGIDYFVTVTQKNINVKLQQGGTETYHPTIAAAYNSATDACTIRSTCVGFDGTVEIYKKGLTVTIDGGQDCCLEKNQQGYTMIRGLNVTQGKVIVKGLKVF